MKVALTICPFFMCDEPPLSIYLLSSVLKKAGHDVIKFDLNKIFQLECNNIIKYFDSYFLKQLGNENNSLKFISENSSIISKYVDKILNTKARVIGFSIYEPTRVFSLDIARRIKEIDKNRIIVFGGLDCNIMSKSFIKEPFVDYVVAGEGDETFPELLTKIETSSDVSTCKGIWFKKRATPFFTGNRALVSDLGSLPYPDFDGILNLYKSNKKDALPIQASRGCTKQCIFCQLPYYQKKYRQMKPERIINEILNQSAKYKISLFSFVDSNLNNDIENLNRFCDLLAAYNMDLTLKNIKTKKKAKGPKNIYWSGYVTIGREITYELLRKLKISGCVCLTYSIQSGSKQVINDMKIPYSIQAAKCILKNAHDLGIFNHIDIIVGFPTETNKDFEETLRFVEDVGPFVTNLNVRFFAIRNGSFFCEHPEKHGITEKESHFFWRSQNNRNNFKERYERYKKLCKLASKFKIFIWPPETDAKLLFKEYDKNTLINMRNS
ncbi:MAG: B12-binding domain-containing radical SAM protein [Elusimicrobia bacterium]|nr:B12-binding domain-containing radical SAM protein [Candidatus Liberimonas magnetica]